MPYDSSVNSRRPTHHVILTDKEGNRLGLISVGNNGRPDDKAMNRNPIDRTAMKTTQGNSKYSDFEFPYTPIPQDTFTGGRGQDEFERNVTRYRDSFRMNTRREGKAFLGAQESYGTGVRTADAVESFPG